MKRMRRYVIDLVTYNRRTPLAINTFPQFYRKDVVEELRHICSTSGLINELFFVEYFLLYLSIYSKETSDFGFSKLCHQFLKMIPENGGTGILSRRMRELMSTKEKSKNIYKFTMKVVGEKARNLRQKVR